MAIALGVVFMALAATAFLTIPQKLIHVYTHDPQTVAVAVRLLAVAAVSVLVLAVILFEPGATERYMPAYPFFFLAAAYALPAGGGRDGHQRPRQ